MRDWAELDAAAALDFLGKNFPAKLMAIGHSFGGQSFALIPGAEQLAAALAVGSQSGYWRHWRGAPRAGMWLLTHALLPGISRLFGYFPAAALGQGENLPAGVAIEWARWCRDPDYLVGALGAKEQYARFSAPLRLYWVADDPYAPLAAADEPGLKSTLQEVQSRGVRVFAMRVDVSRYQEVESFCSKTIAQFGATHVVCNTAGVSPLGAVWENTLADWQWILGVNLWGVINGVRAFVPGLLAQGEGHVVNTASVAGLISPPGMGAYNVTKHAVVALSESLYHDLRLRGSPVGVSVLCPAYVPTGIADSERNRPRELLNPAKSPSKEEAMLKKAVASGKLSADDVARAVVTAVKEERFYVLTHPRIKGAIRARMEDILDERAPRNPLAL